MGSNLTYRKYVVLCGAALLQVVLCVTMYIGNLSTYIYSYHYNANNDMNNNNGRSNFHSSKVTQSSLTSSFDLDPSWLTPILLVAKTMATFIVDLVKDRLGLGLTCGVAIFLHVVSIALTYVTVTHSIWATALTFGVGGGLGNGMVFTCNMLYVSGWFGANRVGLASAVPLGSAPIGGVVLNLLISSYINPDNLSPDTRLGDGTHLFSQPTVLDRVPTVFLLIGGITAGIQILGFCLLKKPPEEESISQKMTDINEVLALNQEKSSSYRSIGHATVKDDQKYLNECLEQKGTATNIISKEKPIQQTGQFKHATYPDNNDPDVCNEDEVCLTPMQVLKSRDFYIIELAILSMTFGFLIVINNYKVFGQLWIDDDQFLAFIGSCSSLCIIAFLLACGVLVDRLGIKDTLSVHLSLGSVILFIWYFTAWANKWFYLIWTVVVICVHNNQFLVFLLASLKVFGRPHLATNYGMIQIGSVLAYLLGPPVITYVLSPIGWFGIFATAGCLSFVALVLVLCGMRP